MGAQPRCLQHLLSVCDGPSEVAGEEPVCYEVNQPWPAVPVVFNEGGGGGGGHGEMVQVLVWMERTSEFQVFLDRFRSYFSCTGSLLKTSHSLVFREKLLINFVFQRVQTLEEQSNSSRTRRQTNNCCLWQNQSVYVMKCLRIVTAFSAKVAEPQGFNGPLVT